MSSTDGGASNEARRIVGITTNESKVALLRECHFQLVTSLESTVELLSKCVEYDTGNRKWSVQMNRIRDSDQAVVYQSVQGFIKLIAREGNGIVRVMRPVECQHTTNGKLVHK